MSRFDAMADSAWSVASSTHGDSATFRPGSGGAISVTVICHLEVVEAGSIYETRGRSRTIEIKRSEISRPVKDDEIEVTTGRHAGTYQITGVDDEDEYSYWVAVG